MGAASALKWREIALGWLLASSATAMPVKVPRVVPSPFWTQAAKRLGSSSRMTETPFRLRQRWPAQLYSMRTSLSAGKRSANFC